MSTVWRRIAAAARRWRSDVTGGATVLVAFFGVVLVGSAAVSVDGAHFFLVKRHQQAATDMAAMAAAASLATAAPTAAAVMTTNGFPQATLQVTPGSYAADPTLAPAARFAAAGSVPNAVQVVSTTFEPFIFGAALQLLAGAAQPGNGFAIRTAATARKQDVAAFTLGSGVASLDPGLANAVLGGLLGTTLTLSALDYQSLGSASVDLLSFSDALAAQLQLSGATYGSLAVTAASQSTLVSSLAATLQGTAQASAAVRAIATALPTGTASSSVGSLIDFGPAGTLKVGSSHPLSARVPALSFLSAMAVLGGSGHAVSLNFGNSLPGLSATQLMLAMGEPAAGSSFAAIGAEGATLHTAQVRLLLTTAISGAGLPASLSVPLYLEVAPATATISAIACSAGASAASVTLGVTPGLANAAIGSVAASDVLALSSPPPIGSATLLTLAGLLRITAKGQVAASSSASMPVSFSAADIQAGTAKTVSSGVSLAALTSSLVNNTAVTVTTLGVTLPSPGLPQAVTTALQTAMTPIDALLGQTLATLGLSLGTAATTVPGVRCGQGTLVN